MNPGWRMASAGKAGRFALAAAFMLAMVCGLRAAGTGNDAGYHILAKYTVGRRMGNVGVDSAARRIFVTTSSGVEVLDADSGERVSGISVSDARDVLLVPALKRGFVSSGSGDSITMFAMDTLKILKVIHLLGKDADALAYGPGTRRVFVAETGSGEVAAIDAETGSLVSSVPLSGRLEQMVADGYGELFVAADDKDAIHVVDPQTLKFLGDFPVDSGCSPSALALGPYGRRLFVACRDGQIQIIDTDIGFTFERLPIGTGDAGEAFTFKPQGEDGWKGATFVVSSDGVLSLVRMDAFIHYSSAGRVTLQPGTVSVAYDSKTHHLFVPAGPVLLVVGQ
jgi:DNA-binding beta-propeller fold protein YncE